ncbi:hypothetical protein [Streptococcus suis]|nr:hypothetical protein [Streptococcus suis]CYV53558.1 Uncharacterised protein [Streptococcus suis]
MALLILLFAYLAGIIFLLIELKRAPLVADDEKTIISEDAQTIK